MMNRQTVTAIAAVTGYLVWLLVFVLVIERWLRRLVGGILGVEITREVGTFSGGSSNISLLDVLDAYRWRVNGPASLSIRAGVGLLRVGFWLLAVTLPLAVGFYIVLTVRR
jgi:hypothetical protein